MKLRSFLITKPQNLIAVMVFKTTASFNQIEYKDLSKLFQLKIGEHFAFCLFVLKLLKFSSNETSIFSNYKTTKFNRSHGFQNNCFI